MPGEMRRHVDQIRVDREMREAAAIGKERLARVAVGLVLPDRVLDILAVQRVLQLRGEDRNAVEEQHEIEAFLVLLAVPRIEPAQIAEISRRIVLLL